MNQCAPASKYIGHPVDFHKMHVRLCESCHLCGVALDEIEAFFTGDEKYKDSRLAILKESGVVQSYVVGGISIALAPVLGTSAPFLAPVIAIVLLTIGKIGLNAWLATRREKREKESNPEK